MENIEILYAEIQQFAEQIEEKRKEAIIAKLIYLQKNNENEISNLTEEENEIIEDFLTKNGDPSSVIVQNEWWIAYYPEDSRYDYNITNCYVRLGDRIYSTRENKFIDESEIEEDFETENPEEIGKDDRGRKTIVGKKNGLIKPLDIEQLFEVHKKQGFKESLLNGSIEEIKKINEEIKVLKKEIEERHKECIKEKLIYLQKNDESEISNLTEEEKEIIQDFLTKNGDPSSVIVQNEWLIAYYPEDSGYDYNITNCYVRLGDRIYSTRENKFIDESEIEEDFETENPEEIGKDDTGRKTIVGKKDGLTKPLDIEQLFEVDKKQGFKESLLNGSIEEIKKINEETFKPLENMTQEELKKAISNNDRTITDNDEVIKQALIQRLLEQQKIISAQQSEIDRLNSQKKEL